MGYGDCDQVYCNSESDDGSKHCNPHGNCSSGNYCCDMKCKGRGCKQTCISKVKDCKMDLECTGNDCNQECNADNCNLNCRGKNCKAQKCQGKRNTCEMHLECNNQECEQTCEAKECNLNCSGENCKIQKCVGEGHVCEMHLECNNPDCEQICDAEVCNLTCSGRRCKTQSCTDKVRECNTHFNAKDCTQTCDGHSITSDSYKSNIVTSIGASTIRVFATKISTGHGMETYSEYNNT